MKIGRKLVLTFILISLISSISGVVGFSMMKTMARQYSVVLEKYGFSQGDVGLFNTEFNNNNVIMRDIILQGTVADKLKNKEQLDQSSVKLNQYLARMKTSMVSGDEQNYYNTILDCLQQYAVARDQVVQLAISEDSPKASNMMAQDCTPALPPDAFRTSPHRCRGRGFVDSSSAQGYNTSQTERGPLPIRPLFCLELRDLINPRFPAFLTKHDPSRPIRTGSQ